MANDNHDKNFVDIPSDGFGGACFVEAANAAK
jgi:hypothetical protein